MLDKNKFSALLFSFISTHLFTIFNFFLPKGASPVDFLYYFATVANETHPGLARVEGSPIAGKKFLSFLLDRVMLFLQCY